jgi:hypothetical protein
MSGHAPSNENVQGQLVCLLHWILVPVVHVAPSPLALSFV